VRKTVVVAAALALVSWLGALTAPVLQSGDAAVYNDQVNRRHLAVRMSHIGYLALGIVFRALLPGPTDLVMNRMTVVIGVAGLAVIYSPHAKISSVDPFDPRF
jgi:hypothetical protein